MKLRDDTLVRHVGTMEPVEEIQMSIHSSAMAHIMKVLTDLYSDPALAVIREYSTNAFDSHRAAGIKDPIEIELPSGLRPTFVVRDHGVGMSLEQIREQFSKYGYSSKRDSNDEVGILGLGCKSGLTYTSQFTLIAVKDGKKTTVLITRDDHGVGVMQIIDTILTEDRNGVEIQIPVADPRSFIPKAEHFFRFWETNTVLVNGKAPVSVFDDPNPNILKLDEDVVIVKRNGYRYGSAETWKGLDRDYVVMGNIAYPADNRIGMNVVSGSHNVVVRIGIGEIDFTPSREALHYTKHTLATVTAINKFVGENLKRHAQETVDAQKTRWDAAKEALRWQQTMDGRQVQQLTYHGEHIPLTIPIEGWEWSPSNYNNKSSKCTGIPITTAIEGNVILVRSHPVRSMDATLKDALKAKYGDKMGRIFAISELTKPEHGEWLKGCEQVEYSIIRPRAVRQPKGQNAPVEIFKWMIYKDGKFVETDQGLTASRICYILRTDPEGEYIPHTRENYRRLAAEFVTRVSGKTPELGDMAFAVVRKPEVDKFLKLHPQAQTFSDFLQKLLTDIDAKLSDDALTWGNTPHDLRMFDADEILDPEVGKLVRRIQQCSTEPITALHVARKEVITAAHQLARITLVGKTGKSDIMERLAEWREAYPLVARMVGQRDHHLEYMNGVYSYRQDQQRKKANV